MNALTVLQPAELQPAVHGTAAPTGFTPDIKKYQRWFRAFETNKQDELDEMLIARQYYNGKQWTEKQIAKLRARGQAPIFDNRIARKIDFLVGVEQRMRRDPKAFPRTPNDEQSADVATAGMRYSCELNRWEAVASNGTADGMIDGVGVCFVGIKSGKAGLDPEIKHVQRDRFFYDPRSVKPDFSDARYMGLHLWMDVDEAKEKWPQMSTNLDELVDRASSFSSLTWTDQNYGEAWADFEHRRIRVIEMWEKTPNGWAFCYFCGDTSLEADLSPYVDEDERPDCPYAAWSPYIDEKGDRYSPIRNMKPMQDEINHRRSKFLHLLSQKTVFVRRGSVDDLDEFRREVNKADGIIEHDGEWNKDTGIVDKSQDIKGQAELLAQSQSSLENLGPNPGLIGKGGGVADQSGRAILAQRDSGMTELSPVFERNRDWKLRVYRKVWARIKQAWTGEKWVRITDDGDAPKFLGLNQYSIDPMTGQPMAQNIIAMIDVDIIMDEGPDTMTMNEELLQTLSQLGPNAVPPKILIELSNAPNKDKLFKMIDEAGAPNPEVAAMQARMAKLEEMLKAAEIDSKVAATEQARAGTIATLSTAFTPKQAPTDEFGNATGPAPAPPDLGMAFSAMQAFPLQYREPTLEQMALNQPVPLPEPEEGEQAPMNALMQGMPPPDQMPGGLPIDPGMGAF